MQYIKREEPPKLIVHERITKRHPELTDDDMRTAWEGALLSTPRIAKDPDEHVAIGFDAKGRLLEVVAIRLASGDWLAYHAMTPPSRSTFHELGITRR